MLDFLNSAFQNGPTVSPADVAVRLLVALLLGGVVAWVYRMSRVESDCGPTFPVTLVLLSVLIAMVTQVIGDNVARAFSLVGALSIVRFRTVVRDTRDTAFVICAVVVGMAVGARNPWVAGLGLAVVGLAAFAFLLLSRWSGPEKPEYLLKIRVGLGSDVEAVLARTVDPLLAERNLLSIGTARQGISLEASYRTRLRPSQRPEQLIRLLNDTEGVHHVLLCRSDFKE
jgi:hypothetical protein